VVWVQLCTDTLTTEAQMSDSSYLATIMAALAHSLITDKTMEINLFAAQNVDLNVHLEDFQSALAEVDRYLSMDRLVPSYRNAITIACLEVRSLSRILNGYLKRRIVEDQDDASVTAAGRLARDRRVHEVRPRILTSRGWLTPSAQGGQLCADPNRRIRLPALAQGSRG
jgi:hypothetical protein